MKTYGLRQISLYLLLLLILTYLIFIFSIFFSKNLYQNKKHSTTYNVISIINLLTKILEN